MKALSIFGVLFVLLSIGVFAVGLGMSPEKHFDALIGENFSTYVIAINEEGSTGTYNVLFGGKLAKRARAEMSIFKINPRNRPYEEGTETTTIWVDSTGLLPGTYDLQVIVEAGSGGSGGLSIIQKVSRTIYISYEYPPSTFSKIKNFVILGIKGAWEWATSSVEEFYKNNPWLNYLFVLMLLAVFFYVGTKAKIIFRYIKREKERMANLGFKRCLLFKLKDTFKKLRNRFKKSDIKHEQKEGVFNR